MTMTLAIQVLFKIRLVIVAFVLLPLISAYEEGLNLLGEENCDHADQKLSPRVTHQVIIHGFLLWASMGFLTPVGILLIRMNSKLESRRISKILYYLHLATQISSALLVTVSAVMSMKNFPNLFNNSHQRMGLALYIAVWVQSLIGFFRPKLGANGRSIWFFIHWLFGTFVLVLGILSVYSGFQAYHRKTFRSATTWTALFTVEIVLMAFGYLLQDKWKYIQKQEDMTQSLRTTQATNQDLKTRSLLTTQVTNQQYIPQNGYCG